MIDGKYLVEKIEGLKDVAKSNPIKTFIFIYLFYFFLKNQGREE